jgi:hypothetical protein
MCSVPVCLSKYDSRNALGFLQERSTRHSMHCSQCHFYREQGLFESEQDHLNQQIMREGGGGVECWKESCGGDRRKREGRGREVGARERKGRARGDT